MDRITQLRQFLEDTPTDAFLNYALATEYISQGNDSEAEVIFRNLMETQPNYVATYYHLAKLLERKKEKEAAIEIYEKGIQIAKSSKDQHSLSELQSAMLELEYE